MHQSGKCPTVELTSTLFALIKIFRSLIGGQEHMDIRDVDEIQVVDHVDLPQVVHHIEQPHNLLSVTLIYLRLLVLTKVSITLMPNQCGRLKFP